MSSERRREHQRISRLGLPALVYAGLQVVILTRLGAAPALREFVESPPVEAGVVVLQFAGLSAVFFSTRLRDMGMRHLASPLLLWVALLGAILGFVLFPAPEEAGRVSLVAFLGVQLAAAGAGAAWTMVSWGHAKVRFADQDVSNPNA